MLSITIQDVDLTYDKLDNIPNNLDSEDDWFNSINMYSLRKLKKYMKENNLRIVSGTYYVFPYATYDDLLATFHFEFYHRPLNEN